MLYCEKSMIQNAYFLSLLNYGIIFWGNSSYSHKGFKLQRIARMITGSRSRDLYRDLFENINILTLPSQYIFSLSCLATANRYRFMFNSEIHRRDARQLQTFINQYWIYCFEKGFLVWVLKSKIIYHLS